MAVTIILLLLCSVALICCQDYQDDSYLGPLQCPANAFSHRHGEDIKITCNIYIDNGDYNQIKHIYWHTPEFSLEPGSMTNSRIEFLPLRLTNNSIEATLLIRWIETSLDFDRNYILSMFTQRYGKHDATVALHETGQGKVPFRWWDYLIFGATILVSLGIGVYHAFFGQHKIDTQDEYMLGGRSMTWLPVSLSLLASFMSAIVLMGTASEVYSFGTQYLMIALAYPFVSLMGAFIFLPVYYKLRITSAYEYLEMRFSKPVRVVGAVLFLLQMVLYMSMVVFAPAIALQAVMGVDFWLSSLTTVTVCVFYTAMGGLRATMWTDAFQVCIMYVGISAIFIAGCLREGGFLTAWDKLASRDRAHIFEMNPDPRIRHSFWTVTVGSVFTWLYTYGANQAQVQRGLSCKSMKHMRLAYLLNIPGLITIMLIPGLCGVLIFSRYANCDPLTAGEVTKRDQMIIYYVVDVISEDLPGISGLFVASLFAGALSTISSGINGLAAVTFRDFGIENHFRNKGWNENRITWLARIVSALYGGLCILLIFPIQTLPGLLDGALGLFGAIGGPLLGTFFCGVLVPWINGIGALAGLVVSTVLTAWITFGSKASPNVAEAQPRPSISTMACDPERVPDNFEPSFIPSEPLHLESLNGLEHFYSISYLYLSIIGVVTSIGVGMIVSTFTGLNRLGTFKGDRAGLLHPWVYSLDRLRISLWAKYHSNKVVSIEEVEPELPELSEISDEIDKFADGDSDMGKNESEKDKDSIESQI